MKKQMLRSLLALALSAGLITSAGVSAVSATETTTETTSSSGEFTGLTIVYTNDIHCHIANEVQSDPNDENSEKVPGLRMSSITQMVKDLEAEGKEVLLIDAGDEVQGGIYGAMSEGEAIIDLMNTAGYDLATLGNHEFDYGMDQMFKLTGSANFPYITCNFHYLGDDADSEPFEAYKIFDINGKKVAFIGITTPESITSSTPTYFQDAAGNYIYDFDGSSNPQDLYDVVQKTIDEVSGEADYIIGLGHTGVAENSQQAGVSSYEVIKNTSGFDAYIDGHSHTTMEGEEVTDKDGNPVLLTQTGCYLNAVGQMTISADGEFSTQLITEYEGRDPEVEAAENEIISAVDEEMGVQIGVLSTTMYINNPDLDTQRLIRSRELNLGDFNADSVYWYLNEDRELDCDVVLCNGGNVRTQLPAGPVTNSDIKNVNPFGNMICLINATGQQILDALEMGVTVTGVYDEEWQAPAENGGFMQVAGLKYSVDATVPSGVQTDDKGMFTSVEGDYRVHDVEIYNRETGEYEPMDLEKTYAVGGCNYILRNSGNGLSMFANCDMVVDYIGEDWEILADYVQSFTKDGDYALVKTENSPLAAYTGYQLDYENPYGAGRINITGTDENE